MTRTTTLALLGGALLLAAQAATADISATITGTTDYDFRGVSLSAGDPAIQGSVDYTNGMFYASVWGSNLDYGPDYDSTLEVDLIAGLTGEMGSDMTWDTGIVVYTYPNSTGSASKSQIDAYPEVYAGGRLQDLRRQAVVQLGLLGFQSGRLLRRGQPELLAALGTRARRCTPGTAGATTGIRAVRPALPIRMPPSRCRSPSATSTLR